jgi:CPA2 family monovalent cation:H+ antiporter-2
MIDPLTTIGVVLIVGLALSLLFKLIGQNPVLGFILSGFLLGPLTGGFLTPENELLKAFSELGLFVLLFYLGIELSFRDFVKAGLPTFSLALLDMSAMVVVGVLVSLLAGFSFIFSLIVGVMLLCSSSAIVGKFLLDNNIIKQKSAQLALAILILQDFLGIFVLVFVTSLSQVGSSMDLALTALLFAVVAFYAVHRFSGVVERFFQKKNVGTTELAFYALGLGLVVAAVGSFLKLNPAIGAYFAGFALSELKAGEKVKGQIDFLRDFFLLFFFVAFGTSLFFDTVVGHVVFPPLGQLVFLVGLGIVLTIGAIVGHALVFTVFGPLFGLTNRSASEVAIFLTPLGEFVVIIAISAVTVLKGTEAALLAPIAFMLILFTLFVFQPLYKKLDWHDRITNRIPSLAPRPRTEETVPVHTPESLKLLRDIALNLFILLCLVWIAALLYKAIPEMGISFPYGRLLVTIVLVLFIAVKPIAKINRDARKLWHLGCTNPMHHHLQTGKTA